MSLDTNDSSALWTTEALKVSTNGTIFGKTQNPVMGVSIDTRTLQAGDMFVALSGQAKDGHEFVATAFDKGAGLALVTQDKARDLQHLGPLLAVENVLKALETIGAAARQRLPQSSQVIAVTGSVGKTTTKEMLKTVLSRQASTHASIASYNNHFGVPLTLARMPKQTSFGIFEIGMSAPFEILPLTRQVRPHVAIVTTIEPVHREFFRAMDGIADAKGEIFSGLVAGGTAILNHDNPYLERLRMHAQASQAGRIITFGQSQTADIHATSIKATEQGSRIEAKLFGHKLTFEIGLPGHHQAINALGILACVAAVGADVNAAAEALSDVTPASGRGTCEIISLDRGEIFLIDESYNANPASMKAALVVLGARRTGPSGRRIAVMGDMLELGHESPKLHAGLAEIIGQENIDLVFAAGSLMKHLWDELPARQKGAYALTAHELVNPIIESLRNGDVVMVKGSNGSRMGHIVNALRRTTGSATPG